MNEDTRNQLLGARIRQARKAHHLGLTQRELADSVGVSRSYITQIENGIRTVSIPVLRRIADALDVTLEELLGEHANAEELRRLREQREKFEAATRSIVELSATSRGTSSMITDLTTDPRYDIVAEGMESVPPEERIRMVKELLDSLTPEQRAKALEKE